MELTQNTVQAQNQCFARLGCDALKSHFTILSAHFDHHNYVYSVYFHDSTYIVFQVVISMRTYSMLLSFLLA